MKTFLILGAGTAGTMIAKKMSQKLDPQQWRIIVVDRNEQHYYQPGFLFLPFGSYKPQDVVQPKRRYIPSRVEFILSDIERIEPDANRVLLTENKRIISYDYLVIATGCDIRPEETEGLLDGGGWRKNIFDFYTYEGAVALHQFLEKWPGGRLVLNVAEMPIKCPVAPLEFLFLADDFFTRRGIRNKVELIYATPLSGAFTKPKSAAMLGGLFEKKHIHLEPDFAISDVDSSANVIHSYDGREIPFDLFVTIPVNGGAEVIGRSGMGNDLDFVPTDKFTLQSKKWPNIWVMGDAADIPASKAGAVVHFQLEVVVENILAHMAGRELHAQFDGHASCYIETGFNKALLIDFDYNTEPLPGHYPIPGIGPFSLLSESVINHWGKLGFRFMYWNLMMRGLPMPVPDKFSMAGKRP
jgi:sulfide:quinone oxidoreductase